MKSTIFFFLIISHTFLAQASLPERYTELLPYVQAAPDQGETSTCLFMASTGAMELIANKKEGIKNPAPYGKYDLSESFIIHAPNHTVKEKYFWEIPVLKFNHGFGIHMNDWPYNAWNGADINHGVWDYRDWRGMTKVVLPKVETIPLFVLGNKWSTNVLEDSHVELIKEALWKYKTPILANYNDDGYWHVILIVGFDDKLPGLCYDETPEEECNMRNGSFYVRDSFGISVEVRDYDWFRVKGNAAFVVKEVE